MPSRATRFAAPFTVATALLFGFVLLRQEPDRPKSLRDVGRMTEADKREEGHAGDAFEWWYGTRAYPNDHIPKSAFYSAFLELDAMRSERRARDARLREEGRSASVPTWSSIGPDNIGGRILALAIDPLSPNVIWAGAASGGLWRSTSGGEGADAWDRIETGYPSISVSTIALDPEDPARMWIGTGEISRYQRGIVGTPGARSSYGLGILRSTDAGASWQTTGLTWTFDQSRAVLALQVDPFDSNTLWAATSEGLYKTTDAGDTWTHAHSVLMAMDVVLDPSNEGHVFVSHGQLNSAPNPGIYRSTDGGDSWTQLTSGLPASDFGRTPLALVTSGEGTHATVYAGVSNAVTRQVVGLYRSTDHGLNWSLLNSTNWASSQAWYNNVVSVSPWNPDLVLCCGLDTYRSTNGGSALSQVAFWWAGYGGVIPPGGDEGPSDYVHADQHAVAWHPVDPNVVYVASDGGVFKSTNGGATWDGKNGGLVTTQFYAGFATGWSTNDLALGGLQDNGTVKYLGTPSWSKVYGGDGGYCAIDPTNENVLYEEYVYLTISKSTDGGDNWFGVYDAGGAANFIAPFVLCPSAPQTLYGGAMAVVKTTNGGSSWNFPDGDSDWNGTPIASIGVSPVNANHVVAATGSSATSATFEVRRSTNGGTSWTNVTAGLPTRFVTDITFDPDDAQVVWMTFSGYGTPHVFRSTNAGSTWTDRSGNLPDIPVQAICVDPLDPSWVYVGTDLGVFRSIDGGASWIDFGEGMPVAMVLDVVMEPDTRVLRAATFGNGVYEVTVPSTVTDVADDGAGDGAGDGEDDGADGGIDDGAATPGAASVRIEGAFPNPSRGQTELRLRLSRAVEVGIEIYDATGARVRELDRRALPAGEARVAWDGRDQTGRAVPAGVYFARVTAGAETQTTRLVRVE